MVEHGAVMLRSTSRQPSSLSAATAVAVFLFGIVASTPPSQAAVDFSWSPPSPEIGEPVSFSISGHEGEIVAEWDFGGSGCSVYPQVFKCDPGITECQNAVHKYSEPGLKEIALTIKDPATQTVIGTTSHFVTVQGSGQCFSGELPQDGCSDGDVHDDGSAENGYGWSTADAFVEKFTPSTYPLTYTEVCVGWTRAGADDTVNYQIVFYDDDGPSGMPGSLIASIDAEANDIPSWLNVAFDRTDVSGQAPTIDGGSVYVGVTWDDTTDLAFYVASDESITTPPQSAYHSRDWFEWLPVSGDFPLYRALLIRPRVGSGPPGTAWERVVGGYQGGGNGFGDSTNDAAECMAIFNGYLYVGTRALASDSGDGAEVWRTNDGDVWALVNSPGFGDSSLKGVRSMAEFGGALYVGNSDARIWRTTTGFDWTQVDGETLRDGENAAVLALTEYGGYLYAGTLNIREAGCEVWRSSDGTSWTQVQDGGFGVTENWAVSDMLVVSNGLYVSSSKGIWRTSDGIAWFPVLSAQDVIQLAGFDNHLFSGGTDNGTWWSADGTTWTQVAGDVFEDPGNDYIYSLEPAGFSLIAGTYSSDHGGEVWQSLNGHQWDQLNKDGFGHPNDGVLSLAVFRDDLYAGTVNETGLEIWRLPTVNDPTIFEDDFELGNTTAWSKTVP
jgi:hypothetical protein